jgi:hypothetical protein
MKKISSDDSLSVDDKVRSTVSVTLSSTVALLSVTAWWMMVLSYAFNEKTWLNVEPLHITLACLITISNMWRLHEHIRRWSIPINTVSVSPARSITDHAYSIRSWIAASSYRSQKGRSLRRFQSLPARKS